MLDIGWPELMVVAVVTLLVVGPKELPRVLRTVTLWVRKAREVARDFQSGLDEMVREADLDDVKKQMTEAASANLGTDLDELMDSDHSIGGEFAGDPFADTDKSPTASGTETATAATAAEAETPVASEAEAPAVVDETTSETTPEAAPETTSDAAPETAPEEAKA